MRTRIILLAGLATWAICLGAARLLASSRPSATAVAIFVKWKWL